MGNAIEDYGSVENESTSDRFYSIGATYNNGPIAAYLAVDSINYASWSDGKAAQPGDQDDSLTVTLGGSYDFEAVKVYLGAQYFDEVKLSSIGGITKELGDTARDNFRVKGYGISLTGDAPLAGGKAMFGVGYVDAEAADSVEQVNGADHNFDLKRYVVSVGYDYPFSKRTDVYAVASYMQDQTTSFFEYDEDADLSAYTVYVGLRHKF